ncbi:MAG: hypothetical protein AN484_26585, partial [Aphanizomenon flos-aquae WA102]
IYGHSQESKIFPFTRLEHEILKTQGASTVSILFQEQENGEISPEENTILFQALDNYPAIQHKVRLLHRALRRKRFRGREHTNTTTATDLFHQPKNMSQLYKRKCRQKLDEEIKKAPAYQTRRRDGVYYPETQTFNDAYRVLDIPAMPSKTKEVAFQILNRTIWTNNKAFKSGRADSPSCQYCEEVETMEHLLYDCEHYSQLIWQETSTLFTRAIATHTGDQVARINLTPLEIVFNKPHPSILLKLTTNREQMTTIMVVQEIKREINYRRMHATNQQRQEPVLLIRIQAHILSAINKVKAQYIYQGISREDPTLRLLTTMTQTMTEMIN